MTGLALALTYLSPLQLIFFGANDACHAGYTQHVPLELYKQSLKELCLHPTVTAHNAQVILVTPPPVNEYQLIIRAMQSPIPLPARTAANTRRYAQACVDVADELGVACVDIWRAFMTRAGWREGDPLPGSKDCEPSDVLESLLADGESWNIALSLLCSLPRSAFPTCGIPIDV